MSTDLNDKISRLKKLNETESKILDTLMADPAFKVKDVYKSFLMGESTFRNLLTGIFEKLEVPDTVPHLKQRQWVYDEYSEAYRWQHVEVIETPEPVSEPIPEPTPEPVVETPVSIIPVEVIEPEPPEPEVIYINIPKEEPEEKPIEEPRIFVSPPSPRRQSNSSAVWVILGIVAIAVIIFVATQTNKSSSGIPSDYYLQFQEHTIFRDKDGPFTIELSRDFFISSSSQCKLEATGKEGFTVATYLTNTRWSPITIEYDGAGFSAIDDTGKSYELWASGLNGCSPSMGKESVVFDPGISRSLLVSFWGEIPDNAKYIYITIDDILGSGKIVFRKDL
jgi:hypothetical protein